MKELTLSRILRMLAIGINPETGEQLPHFISIHTPAKRKYFLKLADEIEDMDEELKRRAEKKNNTQWKPWSSEEELILTDAYNKGVTTDEIAIRHDRSEAAIILRLIKTGHIKKNEIPSYISPETKEKVERYIQREEERRHSRDLKRGFKAS